MGKIIFILGGAHSGKSTFAVNLAKKISKKVLYLATAQPKDKEMDERIKRHKKNRPPLWRTVEEPLELLPVFLKPLKEKVIIIDCLTLYISNLLISRVKESTITDRISALIKVIKKLRKKTVIVVSNEVSLGIVPANQLARHFRDIAGWQNQIFAKKSQNVYFLVSGIPLKIK